MDLSAQNPVEKTGCVCTAPGFCHRHNMTKIGRLFELCQTRKDYFDLWESGKGRPEESHQIDLTGEFPCVHRGPIHRTEKCEVCGQREVVAAVRWCAVHGECTVHAHGLRRPGGRIPVCLSCSDRKEPPKLPLVIDDFLCLGDVTVLAAAVRELADQHAGMFNEIIVRSDHPYLFEGGGASAGGIEVRGESLDWAAPENAIRIKASYDAEVSQKRSDIAATINESSQRPHHFLEAYCEGLSAALDLPPLRPRRWLEPVIRLTDEEKGWFSQVYEELGDDKPFWLINAGCKSDYTAKLWHGYQELVGLTKDCIRWVQVGAASDIHKPLDGVDLNLVGKTDGRELVRLVYHAEGVVCGVTGLAHLAHWVERPNGHMRRKVIVIGGGRESPHWYQYPGHHVLHTIGEFDCCASGGCWRSRVVPLGDGDKNDSSLCDYPEDGVPRCMRQVVPLNVAGLALRLSHPWLGKVQWELLQTFLPDWQEKGLTQTVESDS